MQYSRRRAAYLPPQNIRRSFRVLRFGHSCYDWSIPRGPMNLGDIVTFKTLKPISFHSSILEHNSSSFVRSWKVYFDQRWSERKENPPWQSLRQGRTPFCKHVLRLGPTPPPTYTKVKQLHDFANKTQPSMGDRGKPVSFQFNADLMHKLVVYGNSLNLMV